MKEYERKNLTLVKCNACIQCRQGEEKGEMSLFNLPRSHWLIVIAEVLRNASLMSRLKMIEGQPAAITLLIISLKVTYVRGPDFARDESVDLGVI